MIRVVAGSAGGLRLQVPSGTTVRPTADRVKEALFSSLGDLTGRRVADLYAGSGALGIEALSRGAESATLVESDAATARLIRANLQHTGTDARARVVVAAVRRFAVMPAGGPFDLVLCDPPYAVPAGEVLDVLHLLAGGDALRHLATVVIERPSQNDDLGMADRPDVLAHERTRTYGDTTLHYLTYHSPNS